MDYTMAGLLTVKGRAPYVSFNSENAVSCEDMKKAILHCHDVNEEAYIITNVNFI